MQNTQETNADQNELTLVEKEMKNMQKLNLSVNVQICSYVCVQLRYTLLRQTVLLVFPLIFQTLTVPQVFASLCQLRRQLKTFLFVKD